MTVDISKSFAHFFTDPNPDWSTFSSTKQDLVGPLKDKAVDFSVTTIKADGSDPKPEVKWKLGSLILKVLSIAKYYLFRFFFSCAYMPQSNVIKFTLKWLNAPYFTPEGSDQDRLEILKTYRTDKLERVAMFNLWLPTLDEQANIDYCHTQIEKTKKSTWLIRQVVLEKNGVRFSGFLMGREHTIRNGHWILQAAPINSTNETFLKDFRLPKYYKKTNYNIFMVNNPNVGRSEGVCTPKSIGETQELGLRFIEEALKAKDVAMVGISFGGAAIGQAILQHEFKPNIQYQVMSQMTFGKFSITAEKLLRIPFLKHFCTWLELELNSLDAAQKLENLKIQHTILQRTDSFTLKAQTNSFIKDAPIHEIATLGYSLTTSNIECKYTRIVGMGKIRHLGKEVFEKSALFLSKSNTF